MKRASGVWFAVIGGIVSLVGCTPEGQEARSAARGQSGAALSVDPSGPRARDARSFDAEFDEHGPTLRSTAAAERRLGLRLLRYGCPETLRTAAAVAPRTRAEGTEYLRPGLREWYVNRQTGLEQGFTLDSPPCGEAQGLLFEMGFSGATPLAHGDSVELRDPTGAVVYRYSELHAFDADGRSLPSRMVVRDASVQLIVEDAGARYPVTIDPLVWIYMQKLVAADGASKDLFGAHLAMSADTAVVGVPNATVDTKSYAGAGYVFALSGTTWAQQAKLVAADPLASSSFGDAVAISGDTVVIGSPMNEVLGTPYIGAAYVFTRSGTTWTQQAKLAASDGADHNFFGSAVTLSGDTLLVGAPGSADMGSAYVGAVYVFTRSGSTWSEKAKLVASDRHQYDQFGATLSLDGDRVAIAAIGVDLGSYGRVGAAYIFERSAGVFSQQAKILAPTSVWSDRAWFGTSLSLSGDSVAIGTDFNSGFVFARSGTTWSQQASLPPTLHGGGQTLSLDADTVLSGYPGESFYGSAYVYSRSGSTWTNSAWLHAFDEARDDLFGMAVALRGDWALIATPNAKLGSATEVGAVYAYRLGMSKSNGIACAADSECTSSYCVDGVCCDTVCGSGSRTDCQACSVAAGAASDGTCGKAKAGVVCRPTADLCDAPDSCDGSGTSCPADKALPSGTVCRVAAGVCDKDESCSGTSKACPTDGFKPSTTECRAATGVCDATEYCDGATAACPADKLKPLFSSCRAAVGPCDAAEYCSGFSRDCATDKFAAAGTSCRTAAGPCDAAESCDGLSAACPADTFQPSSTVCRATARDCDAPESCSGTSAACPADQQSADGASCSTGRCEKGACRPEADLRVTLEADKQSVKTQQPIQFTATVYNAGRAEALTVALVLSYPPTAALAQLGGAGWGCQSAAGGALCTVDKLGASRMAALTMTLVPPLEQTVFNVSAQVKSAIPDPVPENNFVTLLVKNEQPGPGNEPPIPDLPTIPDKNGGCSCTLVGRPAGPPPILLALSIIATLALIRRRRAARVSVRRLHQA